MAKITAKKVKAVNEEVPGQLPLIEEQIEKVEPQDAQPQLTPEMLEAFEPPKLKNPNKGGTKQLSYVAISKRDLKLWTPRAVPMKFDWVSVSKEKIARERIEAGTVDVIDSGREWHVGQSEAHSDRYESYLVKQDLQGRFTCTCQGHAYGDTRSLCTHAFAAILSEYEPEEFIKGLADDTTRAGMQLQQISDNLHKLAAMQTEIPEAIGAAIADEIFDKITSSYGVAAKENFTYPEKLEDIGKMRESLGFPLNPPGFVITDDGFMHEDWAKMIPPWQLLWTSAKSVNFSVPAMSADLEHFEIVEVEQTIEEARAEWLQRKEAEERVRALMQTVAPGQLPNISRWQVPSHFTELREHQWHALTQIILAWSSGKKYVFLDAPTGAGKSLLGALAFLEWSGIPDGIKNVWGMVAVTSRDLQDQMHEDFKSAWWWWMIKGCQNYPTANYPERFLRGKDEYVFGSDWERHVDCSDCEFASKKHCRYCDPPGVTGPVDGKSPCLGRCPYRINLYKLLKRPLGMTNMAYLIRMANSMAWGMFENRSVLIMDECDTFESVLMGYVTVEVPEKRLIVLGEKVSRPVFKTCCDNGRADWFAWAGRAKARIADILIRRHLQIKGEIQIDPTVPGEERLKWTADQRDLRRDEKYWMQLSENLDILIKSLTAGDPWIYDGYITDDATKTDSGPVVFKPVRVNMFGQPKLFSRFKNVLLESATLISPDQIARDIGIPEDEFAVITVPRTFDSSRCPVFVYPIADNSMKEAENSWPALRFQIRKVLMENREHRILIHAVSYVQAEKIHTFLKKEISGRTILAHTRDSANKKRAIKLYEETPGAVLISPSLARGADFKHDLCRVQIIFKVPFPNLGDKQIKARLYSTHDGQLWYAVQTIRELVQMSGRVMRAADDWGITWIFDKKFLDVWQRHQLLFPSWYRESVKFIPVN